MIEAWFDKKGSGISNDPLRPDFSRLGIDFSPSYYEIIGKSDTQFQVRYDPGSSE